MKIYDTFSRKIEIFSPIKNKEVSIYVCGITPYDTTHLGHAFTYMFFDVLIRYLRFKGYKINYTQNVTDIDDDLLKKAKEEKKDWKILGNYWTDKFLRDLNYLNILFPDNYVKATGSINKIIEIVSALIIKGFAYEKEGNVYFNIKKFKNYGKLSGYNKKQMILISKERGADPSDPLKINPLDFILWQKAKNNEPFWNSPWGKGRPGWHIECSAMINEYSGNQIDIHGGGRDLGYPHHESEIAQSESFIGKKPFVKYWMHTSMVIYKGEKMSKSLGNLIMISDLSKKYSANIIRWLLLSHHYREPWEFNSLQIKSAKNKFFEIEKALDKNLINTKKTNKIKKFETYMENDLDTPRALEIIYKLANDMNSGKENSKNTQTEIKKMLNILGFSI